MATINRKKHLAGLLPVIILFLVILVSLYLLNLSATNLSESFTSVEKIDDLFTRMVLINIFALITLLALIGANLYRLLRRYRKKAPGSRLTMRMFLMFVLLSVIPVTVVFYFSLQLINRDIDKQSTDLIEAAGKKARILSDMSLGLLQRELLKHTKKIAAALSNVQPLVMSLKIAELRDASSAYELTVIRGSIIIAFSRENEDAKPQQPSKHVLLALKKSRSYVTMESGPESGFYIKIAVPIPDSTRSPVLSGFAEQRYLYASYPTSKRVKELTDSIGKALDSYARRGYLRQYLKRSFILVLTLVLLVSLLAAVWAAFFSTRRLVAPITELAEGTKEIAAGNYSKKIPETTYDELGFLVHSFNDMTTKLAVTSEAAKISQQQVEEQRAYLQAVLSNLSSGVIALDQLNMIKIVNAQCSQILKVNLDSYINSSLSSIAKSYEYLKRFVTTVMAHGTEGEMEWTEEITLFSKAGRQVLLLRGTSLLDDEANWSGYIVVFDDITALLQAQRDSAWSEVARRMAHEIKNPLTPIQLSADRLRRKYLSTMSTEEADLLDRSTNTIIQQVETLKSMVNEFSEYARAPKIQLSKFSLNLLIQEVVEFQVGSVGNIKLNLKLDKALPMFEADISRMRQLLNNVILNALESMEDKAEKQLDIYSCYIPDSSQQAIEIGIRDYGDGFSEEFEGEHFEPYFTTKPKGTGLGLAIVKRIVDEHNGIVWIKNESPKGAKMTIQLPIAYYDKSVSNEMQTQLQS